MDWAVEPARAPFCNFSAVRQFLLGLTGKLGCWGVIQYIFDFLLRVSRQGNLAKNESLQRLRVVLVLNYNSVSRKFFWKINGFFAQRKVAKNQTLTMVDLRSIFTALRWVWRPRMVARPRVAPSSYAEKISLQAGSGQTRLHPAALLGSPIHHHYLAWPECLPV